MKIIGFPRSKRPDEQRIALIPTDISKIGYPSLIYIEQGYGEHLEWDDEAYAQQGAVIVSGYDVYAADIICQPKQWETENSLFRDGQTLFGWIYAEQDPDLVQVMVERKMSGIAWECLKKEHGVLKENYEAAGRLGIQHALSQFNLQNKKMSVAVIGNGNVGSAAQQALHEIGCEITVFGKANLETLIHNPSTYDAIVNCANISYQTIIVPIEVIERTKRGCIIINLTCEGIEGAPVTTIEHPIREVKGRFYYGVTNVPSLDAKKVSNGISKDMVPFYNTLSSGKINQALECATVVKNGRIIDPAIGSQS